MVQESLSLFMFLLQMKEEEETVESLEWVTYITEYMRLVVIGIFHNLCV
jgi:hypothetical protein